VASRGPRFPIERTYRKRKTPPSGWTYAVSATSGPLVREAICRILLEPDGSLLGVLARRGSKVRRVYGGQTEAEELFGRLAKLGRDARIETYPGKRVELPGCGYAGYREASKSGEPTVDVDVNIKAIGNVKFKFVGSAGP
jgi:hypothetical protein